MLHSPTQDHLLFLGLLEQSSQQQLLSLQCKENSRDLVLHVPPVFIFSFIDGQLVLKDISLCSSFWFFLKSSWRAACFFASGRSHFIVCSSSEQRYCYSSKKKTGLLLKSKPLNSSEFDLQFEATFFHYSLWNLMLLPTLEEGYFKAVISCPGGQSWTQWVVYNSVLLSKEVVQSLCCEHMHTRIFIIIILFIL